jgi:5'-nucleotidase
MDFEKAAFYCAKILKKLMPIKSGDVININIPLLSAGEPKGVKVVPQSTGGLHEYYIAQKDEQSQTLFQLAGGTHRSEISSTDTTALAEGFITITPLVADMTSHSKMADLQSQVESISL